MPEEISPVEEQKEGIKENVGEQSETKKKRFRFSKPNIKFWHRKGKEELGHAEAWSDWDFGLFWVVSLVLLFFKMGIWPLIIWVLVWFALKTWREK